MQHLGDSSSTSQCHAVPGPPRHHVAHGTSPGTGGSSSSVSPQGTTLDILSLCHPRGVMGLVGTGQSWEGVTLCHTPLCLGHCHTYIFSMSSFSSKAPGRSRLFPRTSTCRAGQGTPEAPGHQTRQEPAPASLLVTPDSPGHPTRMSQTEKLPSAAFRKQSTSINCLN